MALQRGRVIDFELTSMACNSKSVKWHEYEILEYTTVYAIYFASLIFRESGLQDIFVSG